VGTVFNFGAGLEGRKRDLTCSWKVVLPALSRPRRRTEYSACCQLQFTIGNGRCNGQERGVKTFFTGSIQIQALC
jgi:hypothetical protein